MKFEIVKGREFIATFVVKEDGSTNSLELDPTDTATFTISTISNAPEVIINQKSLEASDPTNGEFTLTLTEEETSLLYSKKSGEEDMYISRASHKGFLEVETSAQGRMEAIIEDIYILDQGA